MIEYIILILAGIVAAACAIYLVTDGGNERRQ